MRRRGGDGRRQGGERWRRRGERRWVDHEQVVSRSGVAVGSCCWPIIVVGRRLKQAGRHGPLWASNWCIAKVHKALIARTKWARDGHKGKTAERIAAGEVRRRQQGQRE